MFQEKILLVPKNSKAYKFLFLGLLFLLSSCFAEYTQSNSRNSSDTPKDFDEVGVDEKLGQRVAIDKLVFQNEKGKDVKLSSYFSVKKPVILILGYYECPKLCSLVFNGFSLSARSLEWTIGKEYNVLTVSVNPDEDHTLAAIKKRNYVNHYGRLKAGEGWHFLTGDEENIKALAHQVGFKYKYDPKIEQYAHAALLMFLTPEGKISRYLYGIDFTHNDLKLALLEASEGTIGTVMEQILLYCFHYDPDSQSYSFTIFFMMQLAGLLTLLILGGYLFRFWRGQMKTKPPK